VTDPMSKSNAELTLNYRDPDSTNLSTPTIISPRALLMPMLILMLPYSFCRPKPCSIPSNPK